MNNAQTNLVTVIGKYQIETFSLGEVRDKFCMSVYDILKNKGEYCMSGCNYCIRKCEMYNALDEKKGY